MQDKYEQAIKETFDYLDKCISDQKAKNYTHLGLLKEEIIEIQMKQRGFDVYCSYSQDHKMINVFPCQHNLPIHIWREK